MRKLFLPGLLLASSFVFAQKTPEYKFGDISPEDFKRTVYEPDSSAAAVVIADIGSSEIVGNTKGSFSVSFKTFRRAQVLNKNGYSISNVSIPLYRSGQSEERLENLKAVTYNLENGKMVATKLDIKSAVFKEVASNNWVVRKFTFPNVKEGSIIEYEYRINSDYWFNLQGWTFQGEYPVMWSEYKAAIPSFLNYLVLSQGYLKYTIYEQKSTQGRFDLADGTGAGRTERASINANVNNYHWVIKDIPALKEESFTSTINNHIAKLQFQLSSMGYPFEPKQYMNSWPSVSKSLMEDENFGVGLYKDNGWLKDELDALISESDAPLDKARKIYYWVRDNFTCTQQNRIYTSATLKNVMKEKKGNDASINLLMMAMMKNAGLKVDPILLSKRSHGVVHPVYPILERFNYVIARLEVDSKSYYLDSSDPILGFGRLDYECYNGHAFMINPEATPLLLEPGEIKEESYTTIFMVNGNDGKTIGSVKYSPGYVESTSIREEVKEKGVEAFIEKIRKEHGSDFTVTNFKIDSLKKYDDPVSFSYDLDFVGEKEDILYINPMFGEGYKENPFKSANRFYPVEIPYVIDQTYNLQMEVPAGYEIDELPKQAVVKFNENNDAYFEYRLSSSGNMISLRSRLQIKKTLFQPEDYAVLREFFSLVVAKHTEQIVFKKKK